MSDRVRLCIPVTFIAVVVNIFLDKRKYCFCNSSSKFCFTSIGMAWGGMVLWAFVLGVEWGGGRGGCRKCGTGESRKRVVKEEMIYVFGMRYRC